jgi:hypothetical protein
MGPGDDAETTAQEWVEFVFDNLSSADNGDDTDVEPTYEGTEGDGGLYVGGLPMGD